MPLSTSSKIRVGTDDGAGQYQLQRQHEARQLAARGDPRQRPERRAGVGRDLEMHALAAVLAPIGLGERGQHGAEPRLVEPQRLQLGGDRGVEPVRGALARAVETASAAAI